MINLSYSENDEGRILELGTNAMVFLPVNGFVAQEQKIEIKIANKNLIFIEGNILNNVHHKKANSQNFVKKKYTILKIINFTEILIYVL